MKIKVVKVATQLAGSRQQSRLIAMLSDYNRLLELQSAAYNSAGAAEKQYNKTLDSMESKLAILKDAWNEFLLDETISNAAKDVVDLATSFLNLINKLNDLPGALGTASKALVAFGVFKGGKKITRVFTDAMKLGQVAGKAATEAGESYSAAFIKKVKESLKGSFGKTFDEIKNKTKKTFSKSTWTTPFPSKLPDLKKDMGFKSIEEYQKKIKDLKERQNNLLNSETLQFNPRGLQQIDEYQKQIDGLSASMEAAEKAASASLAQRNLYQTAVQNGMSVDQAKILLTREATAEEYKEIAAKILGEKATKAEIDAKAEELAAEYALNNAQQIGLLTQIRYTAAALFGSKATRADAVAKLLQANNTWLAKKANDGLNASLLASPIGWFAVGIAAITAALIGMGVAAYNASSNVQANRALKKAEEAAEATSKAIDLVKQSYEDLSNSQNKYDDLQNTLENLVVGTDEWKDKLVEANQQVLELLKTYPKLANYVSIGGNGEYQISSTGWENIKKEQEKSLKLTTAAQILATNNEAEAQKRVVKENYSSIDNIAGYTDKGREVVSKGMAYAAMEQDKGFGIWQEGNKLQQEELKDPIFNKLEKYKEDYEQNYLEAISGNEKALQKMAEKLNSAYDVDTILPTEALSNLLSSFEDYSKEISEQNEKIKSGDTLFKSAVADATTISEEFAPGIVNGVLAGFDDNDIQNKKNELKSKSEDEIYSILEETLNLSKEQIKETYGDLDTDALKDLAANLLLVKDQADKADNAFKKMSKGLGTNSEDMKNLTALMSENGKQLTQDIIDDFDSIDFDNLATKMGLENKDSLAALFGFETFNSFQSYLKSNIDKAKELLSNSQDEINSILKGESKVVGSQGGIASFSYTDSNQNYKSLTGDMNLGEQTAFNQKLVAIATEMGQTGVEKFLEVFSAVYNDSSLVNSEKKALLNALPTIDLEDIQTYEDFENVLDNLGIDVKNLSEKNLSELKDSLGALAATSKRTIIDLTQAKNKLESLKSSKSLVESAIDNNTTSFSEEDWNTLKSAGISMDDFFFTGETYNYLGDMSDLLQKIKDDTNSIRQKMLAQTTKDVEEGAKIADWIDSAQYKQSSKGDIISGESALEIVLKGEDIYDNKGNKVNDAAKEILKQIDPSSYKENMTNDLARKILQGIYDTKYGVGGTIYQNNKSQYGSNIQELQNPQDAQKSATELQNQIAQAQVMQTDTLRQEAETSDEAAVELEKWKALEESATKALQNKWTVLKGSTKELDDYIKKQKKVDKVTDDLREQYKAEYLDLKELQGNIKTTREKTKDFFETLEADPGDNNALSQLADAAQRYLGLNLSQEWLEQGDNLKKFKKGISGTEKEFNQFLSEFAEGNKSDFNIAIGLDLDSDEVVKKFQDAGINIEGEKEQLQAWLDEHPIKVDATTGEIDFTAIFNHLVSMGHSAQEVLNALQSLANISISFDTEWDYFDVGQLPEGTEGATLVSIGGSAKWRVPKKITGKYSGPSSIDTNDHKDKDTDSSGGGGGSDSDKEYESNYDKYYNLLKKIERIQENRNKLQDEYSKMLDEEDESYGAIANKQSSILSNLKNEVDYQKQLAAGRLSQINQLQAENSNLTGYASYDQHLNKVQINYDAIKSVKDSDLGGKIDDYISDLETWADSYTDSQQTILELQQNIDDLIKAGTIDLDKSTNVLEQIEEIQNDITNIEAKREILLGSLNFSQQELSKSYEDQLTLLKQQISAQAILLDEREKQYQDSIKKTVGGNWTKFFVEVSKGRFEVNWDILSKENQTVIDEALERLEQVNEAGEAIQEATELVNDAKKALQEFKKELNDQANDLFNQTKDSLIEKYQQQIDKLTAINDSINKSNTNILSAISESIEKQRQERENEKTEQNLSDMQNQLAFLKMDTSGANQVQILELQKSIDEQTEDYTDTLIDQKISELEDQNSKAFEQRQTQIDLMQQHLEYIQKTGEINQEVSNLLAKGIGKDGIIPGSALQDLFEATGGYKAMNQSEKDEFWSNVKQNATSYIVNIKNTTPEDIGIQPGTDISNKSSITKKINEDLQKNGKNESIGVTYNGGGKGTFSYNKSDGSTEETSIKGIHANPITGEIDYMNVGDDIYTAKFARTVFRIASNLESVNALSETEQKWADVNKDGKISAGDARKILRAAARLDTGYWGPADLLKLYDNLGTKNKEFDFNKDGTVDKQDSDILLNKAWMKAKKRDKEGYPIFKTGGLANFTGPAWLDGTVSKPELVLNQRDTENFIQLKDILSSVMRNINGQTATKTGDTYYEIHIEVDKLDSDYSVDDVANRVKQIITTDANYRNVNLINNLR